MVECNHEPVAIMMLVALPRASRYPPRMSSDRSALVAGAFLFAYLICVIVGASALAYVLDPLFGVAFEKVFSRALILVAVVLAFPLARMLGFTASELGLVPVAPGATMRGWLVGVVLVVPPMLAFVALGFRVRDDRVDALSAEFAGVVTGAILSGLLVGIVEELFYRGLLHGALVRVAGFPVAAAVGSTLYALIHFLGLPEGFTLDAVVGPATGLGVLWTGLAPLADPLTWWDSFIALWLLGLGFCWVRSVTGSIWWCVGLHAAFVTVIRVAKELTVRDVVHPWAWLAGEYDHFVGHLVSAWLLLLALVVFLWRRRAVQGRLAG
jgi:membrane protease YdiL (CAAX protease family)